MALALDVLDEDDLTRADHPALAVAGGDAHARVEVDDVLPAGRRMPVEIVAGLHLAEDDAGGRQPLGQPPGRRLLAPLHFDVTEVRLALVVDVQIVDAHERSLSWNAAHYTPAGRGILRAGPQAGRSTRHESHEHAGPVEDG